MMLKTVVVATLAASVHGMDNLQIASFFCSNLDFVPKGAVQDGAFVHLFEWSWSDVAQECEDFLGPKGFQAVQVSPPMEHILGSQWWTRYQPVSYNLTSRSGTPSEFKNMTARCKAAGVEVIADAVINHMAASPSGTAVGTAGTDFYGRQFEPYNYDAGMMHHLDGDENSNCAVTDYTDANNVQQCDLVGLVDLDSENSATQDIVAAYLTSLMDFGAGGVRVDAAKHIKSASLGAYLAKAPTVPYNFQVKCLLVKDRLCLVNGKLNGSFCHTSKASRPSLFVCLLCTQEVIYGDGEAVEPEEYVGNGQVTEFRFGTNLYDNFKEGASGKMQYMSTFGEAWGMLPTDAAVTFTDNHDTQRSASNVLTYKDGQYYNLANYFMLAHPYGHPKVMSSYYFTDTDAGPPSTPVHEGNALHCDDGNTWVCEHRRTGVAGMVGFRLATQGVNTSSWQYDTYTGNGNYVAFARPGLGFFAINMDPRPEYEWTQRLETGGLQDGAYCNVITSPDPTSCSGIDLVYVEGGSATVYVPSLGAVALHVGASPVGP